MRHPAEKVLASWRHACQEERAGSQLILSCAWQYASNPRLCCELICTYGDFGDMFAGTHEVQAAIPLLPGLVTIRPPAQGKVSSVLSWGCDLIFSTSCGRSNQQLEARSGRQCLLGKILAQLRRATLKMVGFLMEDCQIFADRTEDSTPDCRRIIAAAGGPSRPSSSSFGLRWRAIHKLGQQNLLRTASVITKRWGLMFCAFAFCILRMMLEAGSCIMTGRSRRMQHAQLVPSWHGPEDSEAATPSQQFGQLKDCKTGKAS